MIEMIFLD